MPEDTLDQRAASGFQTLDNKYSSMDGVKIFTPSSLFYQKNLIVSHLHISGPC